MIPQGGLERDAGMIAADGDRPDVGDRRQAVKAGLGDASEHGDAARLQRIGGKRRHVAAGLQRHRRSGLERPRVAFRDDVEGLHGVMSC